MLSRPHVLQRILVWHDGCVRHIPLVSADSLEHVGRLLAPDHERRAHERLFLKPDEEGEGAVLHVQTMGTWRETSVDLPPSAGRKMTCAVLQGGRLGHAAHGQTPGEEQGRRMGLGPLETYC